MQNRVVVGDVTMEDDTTYQKIWNQLFEDLIAQDKLKTTRPFLAHYTSMYNLESILKNNEIWLSNPLFMNDLEEVRFGVNNGAAAVIESPAIKRALGNEHRFNIFKYNFEHYFNEYSQTGVMDTFILSLSRQKADDRDGILSMWRAYAANGSGAAIGFDTSKISFDDDLPIGIAPVKYASSEKRRAWLNEVCERTAKLIEEMNIEDDELYLPANVLFERIKLFALFTKHDGFREEKEWRVVYLPDRDTEKKFTKFLHYFNGPRGVEPKLKLRLFGADNPFTFVLDDIITKIILGPSTSSILAGRSIERMLELVGHPDLKPRLTATTIPLRPL